MNIQDIISKKRDKKELNKEEISYFIKNYTNGTITDYQAAALVMAIYINGMNKEEIKNLTLEMAYSGDVLDLSCLGKTVVDKHSTGGVGDKITIILAPIIAALGIPVAKMSGRGLGITGGTRDKLESIPGYKTEISDKEFIQNVKEIGISLIGQTANLAPADKKIYALRDSIACTESIPLIASSIMSKKIASGADKILIDVTYGSGAFMKTKKDAKRLANIITEIGNNVGKETVCILTNMNQPLGYAIGNILEIKEAVNCLKGNMPKDVKDVVLELGSYMIKLAGEGNNLEKNKQKIIEIINNGKAYNKFLELVEKQGGDISYIKDLNKFKNPKYIVPVISKKDFIIKSINAEKIGKLCVYLGAGRIKKGDEIDHSVGIVLNKKVGENVEKGEVLAYIYSNNEEKIEYCKKNVENIILNIE